MGKGGEIPGRYKRLPRPGVKTIVSYTVNGRPAGSEVISAPEPKTNAGRIILNEAVKVTEPQESGEE